MSMISSALLGSLSLSPAEKAFRPWWDDLENYIIYTMLVISIVVAPGGFVLISNVECTRCFREDWCCDYSYDGGCAGTDNSLKDLNAYYVKKYCSSKIAEKDEDSYWTDEYDTSGLQVSTFVAYFQYILLLVAAILVLFDRPFVLFLFKSMNVEQIYKLIVLDDPYTQGLDIKKEVHEIVSCLGSVRGYFYTYLIRTVLSLVGSAAMIVSFVLTTIKDDFLRNHSFKCIIERRYYQCAGYATGLYEIVSWLFVGLLAVYCVLNLYNLIWILRDGHGSLLHRIMDKFQKKRKVSTCLNTIYYKDRNVKLLLCLLSSCSGMASPLRALALIDKNLSDSLVPDIKKISGKKTSEDTDLYPSVSIPAKVVIEPRTLLDDIMKSEDCYITFCVENGSQVEHITESCSQQSLNLVMNDDFDGTVKISTSLNGKIVAVKKVMLKDENEGEEEIMGQTNIDAWQVED